LKVAAENAFIAMFRMESEGTTLLEVFSLLRAITKKQEKLLDVDPILTRNVQEYTKRIAGKIAGLGNSNDGELAEDEIDDEREIASVGGMAF
jgi:hypothetical protein